MRKKRVLFICIHNSGRSQMAEAFLNYMAPDRFEAESAGIEPGSLNPIVVKVMKEAGLDISRNRTKDIQQFIDEGRQFDYIITVCDEASAERCPVFPGTGKKMHMGFEDPSSIQGSDQEKLERTIMIRDQIRAKLEQWVKDHGDG